MQVQESHEEINTTECEMGENRGPLQSPRRESVSV